MRVNILVAVAAALFSSPALSAQSEKEHTVDVLAWPLSDTKPHTLAQISYTSSNATVKKYTTPKIPADDDIIRIGFHQPSGAWSGVATSASNFATENDKKVLLHLNNNGELYHVGFKASDQPSSSKTGKGKDGLSVEVVKTAPGPTPHLNKPVVLNAEGKVDEKEPEKGFFQKYWYFFAGFILLQLFAASGAKE